MDNLEQQLKDTKDIRRKRAEIMRRLWHDGKPQASGKKYTLAEIGEIYGAGRTFVANEIKWLSERIDDV